MRASLSGLGTDEFIYYIEYTAGAGFESRSVAYSHNREQEMPTNYCAFHALEGTSLIPDQSRLHEVTSHSQTMRVTIHLLAVLNWI